MNKQEEFYLIFDQITYSVNDKITKRKLRLWYKDYGRGVWVFTGASYRALTGIK